MSGTIRVGIWVISCLFLMSASGVRAQDQAEVLETQKEKESYSIGYQVGMSMIKDGVDVDFERFKLGFTSAMEGTKPLLTEEEMRTMILDLKKNAEAKQRKLMQEEVVKNGEESRKFLEENAKKAGVRTTESGLQYIILKEGEGDPPGAGELVTVHYRGTYPDGSEFDSSYARGEPQSFKADGVIKGWTEALGMMKTGSKWKIILPPDLAYGRNGLAGMIPPNKVLVFEIELLSIGK